MKRRNLFSLLGSLLFPWETKGAERPKFEVLYEETRPPFYKGQMVRIMRSEHANGYSLHFQTACEYSEKPNPRMFTTAVTEWKDSPWLKFDLVRK